VAGTKILIVDDDPWILRMVSTVLAKRGYLPIVASDGQEGLGKAIDERPDLVITDVMMPKLDGWSLVRHLRARPEFALVPVIFLTALSGDDDRIQGFRLGADDYLPKPFRFEELDLRVGNALRKRIEVQAAARQIKEARAIPAAQASAPAGGENSGIHGSLRQLGLPALLVMLEMEKKSGILVLRSGDQTARLFVQAGRIVAARNEAKGLSGAEVVYGLLAWRDGQFDFRAMDVDMKDEIAASITHLLMEGARLADEQQR
jgi:CheY-like chemotaxis protein